MLRLVFLHQMCLHSGIFLARQFPVSPSTAHNRELGWTAVFRLADFTPKWIPEPLVFKNSISLIHYRSVTSLAE
jgi:hypothetical protein